MLGTSGLAEVGLTEIPSVGGTATPKTVTALLAVRAPTTRKAAAKRIAPLVLLTVPKVVRATAKALTTKPRLTALPTVRRATTHKQANTLMLAKPPTILKAATHKQANAPFKATVTITKGQNFVRAIAAAMKAMPPTVRRAVGKRATASMLGKPPTISRATTHKQANVLMKAMPPSVRKAATHRQAPNALMLAMPPTVRKNVGKKTANAPFKATVSIIKGLGFFKVVTALMKAVSPTVRRAAGKRVLPLLAVRAPVTRKDVAKRLATVAFKAIVSILTDIGNQFSQIVTANMKATVTHITTFPGRFVRAAVVGVVTRVQAFICRAQITTQWDEALEDDSPWVVEAEEEDVAEEQELEPVSGCED